MLRVDGGRGKQNERVWNGGAFDLRQAVFERVEIDRMSEPQEPQRRVLCNARFAARALHQIGDDADRHGRVLPDDLRHSGSACGHPVHRIRQRAIAWTEEDMSEMVVAVVRQHGDVLRAQLRGKIQRQCQVAVEGLGWREQLAEDNGVGIAKALQHRAAVRAWAEISHFALHARARQRRGRAGHAVAD